jgi:hypothetical protein
MLPPIIQSNPDSHPPSPGARLGTGGEEKASAGSRLLPLWLLGAGVVLLFLSRLAIRSNIPWPQCALRTLTGIPCPFCGSTRCLAAWASFDVVQAFRFNPLACVGFGAWLLLWLWDCSSGGNRALSLWRRLQRPPGPVVFMLAALLNWAYLLAFLPK